MPRSFSSAAEVKSSVDGAEGWSDKKARAYMDAWNGCMDRHDGQEKGEDHNCFAIARAAANNAGGGD